MDLKEIFIKNKCDKATKHRYYELYLNKILTNLKMIRLTYWKLELLKEKAQNAWLEYFSKQNLHPDTFERVQAKDFILFGRQQSTMGTVR